MAGMLLVSLVDTFRYNWTELLLRSVASPQHGNAAGLSMAELFTAANQSFHRNSSVWP